VWGEEECIQVLMRNLRERETLEETGMDGRIIFRWIFMKWDE